MGKWFPAVYDVLMAPLEKRKFKDICRTLIDKAQGRVLEIGRGSGVTSTGVSLPVQRLYDLGHLPAYAVKHLQRLLPLARRALWTVGDLPKDHSAS